MAYEDKSGLGVSNHYGARSTGGANGVFKQDGGLNQLVIDFAVAQPLHDDVVLPEGAVIQDYSVLGTPGAVTVTLGATDITTCDIGDRLTWVEATGDVAARTINWTSPGVGKVIIQYLHAA